MPVSLLVVQRLADREEGVSELDESFKKILLVRDLVVVIKPEHKHISHGEAWYQIPKRAAQESSCWSCCTKMQDLVLGDIEDEVKPGLDR